jgi:hypothetical protein
MMHISLRLAAPRQRLMMLSLLVPMVFVSITMIGVLIWLDPSSLEAWALVAICFCTMKPHEIISHLLLAIIPGGPRTDEIRTCLEPALRDAKARLILDGWPAGEPLNAHLSVELVGWRWNTKVLIRSTLHNKQNHALTRALEKALADRYSRFDRAHMAAIGFGSELVLAEPVISNHALLKASCDRDAVQ